MATRGARRRRRGGVSLTPAQRFQRFIRSWEAIIGVSVLIVALVMLGGILRWSISLPFGIGAKPAPPDVWGSVAAPAGSSTKVLYVADVSKGQAADAAGARQAVEMALKDRGGSVKEVPVELMIAEDRCDADQAAAKAAEQIQEPYLIGVISGACPPSTTAAKRTFEEARIPYMVLANSAPSLTGPGTLVTFRMSFNEKSQGREAARIIRQESPRPEKALVLYEATGEHETVAADMRTAFRAQGGSVVDLRGVSPGSIEAVGVAAQAREMRADLVYFSGGGPTALAILNALKAGGFGGRWMVSDAAQKDPEYLVAGSALEGTYASNLQGDTTAKSATFKEQYEKEYGPLGELSAVAYDAATLLLQGSELAGQKKDNQVEFGRNRTVQVMRGFPQAGVSGRLAFDSNGDRTLLARPVVKYEGGVWQEVKAVPPVPVPPAIPQETSPEPPDPDPTSP